MLAKAQAQFADLIAGRALALPFQSGTFDLAFCVNAIHHFGDTAWFADEAWRVLADGGQIAITGMDPHDAETRWYVYDFFPGVYERDLRRYPAWAELAQILQERGFSRVALQTVEISVSTYSGVEVLDDPFLRQEATSQLAALSRTEYEQGLTRIRTAAELDPQFTFKTRFRFAMMVGKKA
jgi:ubiquinone/menaquinone biosynthesis C-methylase UbiE